jgi:hypothetical protein
MNVVQKRRSVYFYMSYILSFRAHSNLSVSCRLAYRFSYRYIIRINRHR